MPDLVVVFQTSSHIEARVVSSLLEAHGIMSVVSSDLPQSIFPINFDSLFLMTKTSASDPSAKLKS